MEEERAEPNHELAKVSQSAVRPLNFFLIWLVMTKEVFVFVLGYVVSLIKTYDCSTNSPC